jgi:hypothetical protein
MGNHATVEMGGLVLIAMASFWQYFRYSKLAYDTVVCKSDSACVGFPLAGSPSLEDETKSVNMTCYKGGETIFNNHQMCNVTSSSSVILFRCHSDQFFQDCKILDMLPGRPPQVTFNCESSNSTCAFQFWTAEIESFYCALSQCTSENKPGYKATPPFMRASKSSANAYPIVLFAERMAASVRAFKCGYHSQQTDYYSDISDFLTEEIKGPASFSCKTGSGCKFEEPAMNQLINDVFGDGYISLECEGGECLHISQVPGYVVGFVIH